MSSSYFKTRDNLRLYYERHAPKKYESVLVFLHGLNEHCGRYAHLVDYFGRDHAVYLQDLRGHGRSDGIRSYVTEFKDFTSDLNIFLELVQKENPGAPIFLVAHSMGGQIALNYLADYAKNPLTGIITSSPNIRIGWKINPIKHAVGARLAKHWPKFKFPGEVDPKWISRDKTVVEAYRNDPLVPNYVTAAIALAVLNNQKGLIDKAELIKTPALMMHAGADRISSPKGTEEFFKKLSSKDKTLKIFDGFYHELFNEIGREDVFSIMQNWLKARV